MDNYKQACRLGLRFLTTKGTLSVEQLWQLSQSELSNLIKGVKRILNKDNDDDLSFLESTKVVDVENQLRFDILKDVYLTKKEEALAIRTAADVKAHNQKILSLIADKQDESLKGKTIEELEAMIK